MFKDSRKLSDKRKRTVKNTEGQTETSSSCMGDDLVFVVKLSAVDRLEINTAGRFVQTHHAKTKSHHEVEASDDDENGDDDDGHGACGQDGLRAERTDHTETSLAGDDGRYDWGHPGEPEETRQVVVDDELKHRPVPVPRSYSISHGICQHGVNEVE